MNEVPRASSQVLALAAIALCLSACQSTPTHTTTSKPWRSRLIEPVTQPTIFESPVIDSQIRPMAMFHQFPNDSIFGGGHANIYAVQARYAVNDRLAIIATKDGYIDLQPDAGNSETGYADIAAGAKYAFIDDKDKGLLVTGGLIYELPSGTKKVFQGNGSGLVRPFVSAGLDCDQLNVLGGLGFNLPLDRDKESTSADWHAQVSYDVTDKFTPLAEINGITWVDNGDALPVDFEGGD